jgi:predicted nucleic acid-binding protein
MILCDTNILIEIYRGNNIVIQECTRIGQQNMAVSDVTRAELFFGARDKRELSAIRKDLNKLHILPIDADISNLAVNFVEQYTLSHRLSLPDAIIAATAIYHNLPLYTLNIKDFRFIADVALHAV